MQDATNRRFRHATMKDYPQMERIYAHARELMARNGNPTQWGNAFPKPQTVKEDIREHRAILLVDTLGGKERILAQFALCPGLDPTYVKIEGAWLDNDSYVTIHRIASSGLKAPCCTRLHRMVPQTLWQCARGHTPQQQGHAACARKLRIRPLRPDPAHRPHRRHDAHRLPAPRVVSQWARGMRVRAPRIPAYTLVIRTGHNGVHERECT